MSSTAVGDKANYGSNATVGVAAIKLVASRSQRESATIQNAGTANNVFVGSDANVTATGATAGLKLVPGASVKFDDYNGDIYVIADVASATAAWFEVF